MYSDSVVLFFFFFSSRRRHTRSDRDWSSDVCSSDLAISWNWAAAPAPLSCARARSGPARKLISVKCIAPRIPAGGIRSGDRRRNPEDAEGGVAPDGEFYAARAVSPGPRAKFTAPSLH